MLIDPASRRVTRKTPTLRPLQISGSAAAAPTFPAATPWRQGSERASFRKSLLMDTLWSRKACPQTPDPSGVLAMSRYSTAHYFLEGLVDLGVEYIFANLGTDHGWRAKAKYSGQVLKAGAKGRY